MSKKNSGAVFAEFVRSLAEEIKESLDDRGILTKEAAAKLLDDSKLSMIDTLETWGKNKEVEAHVAIYDFVLDIAISYLKFDTYSMIYLTDNCRPIQNRRNNLTWMYFKDMIDNIFVDKEQIRQFGQKKEAAEEKTEFIVPGGQENKEE